jgi:hypothetical protein
MTRLVEVTSILALSHDRFQVLLPDDSICYGIEKKLSSTLS